MRHYRMTTDEHFEAAVKADEPAADVDAEEESEKAMQTPAQRTPKVAATRKQPMLRIKNRSIA
jgi:hypothetical protein